MYEELLPKFASKGTAGSAFLYQPILHTVKKVVIGTTNSAYIMLLILMVNLEPSLIILNNTFFKQGSFSIRVEGIKPSYSDPKSNVLSLDYTLFYVCL